MAKNYELFELFINSGISQLSLKSQIIQQILH